MVKVVACAASTPRFNASSSQMFYPRVLGGGEKLKDFLFYVNLFSASITEVRLNFAVLSRAIMGFYEQNMEQKAYPVL